MEAGKGDDPPGLSAAEAAQPSVMLVYDGNVLPKSRSYDRTVSNQDSSVGTEEDSDNFSSQSRTEKLFRTVRRSFYLFVVVAIALIIALVLTYRFRRNASPKAIAPTTLAVPSPEEPSSHDTSAWMPSPSPASTPITAPIHGIPVKMPVTGPFPPTPTPYKPPNNNKDIPTPTPTRKTPTSPRTPIQERKRIFLQSGQTLASGETSTLNTHGVSLKQQNDGNLVLYKNSANGGSAFEIWSSGVSLRVGDYYTMIQGDGHMMTFNGTPGERSGSTAVWKTNSGWVSTGHRLVLNENATGMDLIQSGIPPVKTWSSLDGRPPRPPRTSNVILQSGPMVGHTTHRSTKIWFLAANRSSKVEVVYRKHFAAASTSTTSVAMPPRDEHNGSSLAEIDGLEPSTTYTYLIFVDALPVAEGQFTTAPPPRRPVKFNYLLTSCMNVRWRKGYPEQPVWETILDKKPDFAMFNGDTVYLTPGDWNSTGVIYSRIWQRNLEQREEPNFAKFISSVPVYMTWDDHDFGSDNAHSDQAGKENSLAVLKAFWANPSYGTPDVTGVFYSYYWGNVHFIVMDGRWYRQKKWSQFGEEQLEWLYDQLLRSRAPFKIIVSGATITTYNDLKWIGEFVSEHKIHGVLFNAGDTHKNEFLSIAHDQWPYNVTQFTSSGIARENWMRPWAMLHVDTEAADPSITVSFYGAKDKYTFTTWSNEPTMTCTEMEVVENSVSGWYNKTRCTQTVRLSDLIPEGVSDVVLESPLGGDELVVGSQVELVWRTFESNVRRVMPQYSVNAGRIWKNIANSWIANTGSYVWIVPSDPSARVKVRILTDTANNAAQEYSVASENYGLMSIKMPHQIDTGSEESV